MVCHKWMPTNVVVFWGQQNKTRVGLQALKMATDKISDHVETLLFSLPLHYSKPQKQSLEIAQLSEASCIQTEEKIRNFTPMAPLFLAPQTYWQQKAQLWIGMTPSHTSSYFRGQGERYLPTRVCSGFFSAWLLSNSILLPHFSRFHTGFPSGCFCCLAPDSLFSSGVHLTSTPLSF